MNYCSQIALVKWLLVVWRKPGVDLTLYMHLLWALRFCFVGFRFGARKRKNVWGLCCVSFQKVWIRPQRKLAHLQKILGLLRASSKNQGKGLHVCYYLFCDLIFMFTFFLQRVKKMSLSMSINSILNSCYSFLNYQSFPSLVRRRLETWNGKPWSEGCCIWITI